MELRQKAWDTVHAHMQNQNLIKHVLAVEVLMRALARKFEQDEEIWGATGLVHDIDWEETKNDPMRHSIVGSQLLEKEGYPPEIVSAVKVHNYMHGIEPETLLEKALYATEEMTGFIVACALVQPSKKLADVSIESIMRKMKEKTFAAGVDRVLLSKSKDMLGMETEEVAKICLEEMQKISDKLGL